ncbi:MAG: flagellar hook-basal body complex protein FliE [Limisphaerales bacterium]
MDALSALKVMTGPQGSGSLPNSIQDLVSSATKNIPAAELRELAPAPNSDAPQALSSSAPAGSGFESLLGNFVGDVAQKQATASDTVAALLSGKNVSLHQAMISMEEANISFQMMVEVRNKLLDSYQELMRMQI